MPACTGSSGRQLFFSSNEIPDEKEKTCQAVDEKVSLNFTHRSEKFFEKSWCSGEKSLPGKLSRVVPLGVSGTVRGRKRQYRLE